MSTPDPADAAPAEPELSAGSCAFIGQLNGKEARSFRGTIERAGAQPYLLLGLESAGQWLLDVSGLDTPGALSVKVVDPVQRRFFGVCAAKVQARGPETVGVVGPVVLRTQLGETLELRGALRWRPAEGQASYAGELELELDGRRLPKLAATLSPFNDQYRVHGLFQPAPGESCLVDLRLPAAEDGAWTAPEVSLGITWSQTGPDLEVQTRLLSAASLEARGAVVETAFSVRFRGSLVDASGAVVPVLGRFVGVKVG